MGGKRMKLKRRQKVYASLYRIPAEDKLIAHMVFIVGPNGKLEDYFPGPFTIGEYFGRRLRAREATAVVCSYLKDIHPHMKVKPGDVKLYPYGKADGLLFRLKHR